MEMEKLKNSCPKIVDYDVLRVIVTLLVVLSHCTYYIIMTPYGGCDYSYLTLPKLSAFYQGVTTYITSPIYLFHMPLYMALSGALFCLRGGVQHYKHLLRNKAKKLLIPFIAVALCYSVPLKYISGYYTQSKNLVKDIFVGQVLIQGNTHLWFLPTLFLIFTGAYFIDRYFKISRKILFVSLLIASLASAVMPVLLLKQLMQYAFWFYAGYCFEERRPEINLSIEKHPYSGWLYVFGFILIQCLCQALPEYPGKDVFDVMQYLCRFLCAGFGCCIVYFISHFLAETNIAKQKLFLTLRNNTMGLYLYSDPWNYVILYLAVKYFGNKVFVTNSGAAMLFFCRFIITFAIGLAVSVALRKHKIKYLA